MAVVSNIKCEQCEQYADVWHSPGEIRPRICGACRAKEIDTKRADHFAALDAFSIEERLRLVEEWIYDYKPRIPLSEMRF